MHVQELKLAQVTLEKPLTLAELARNAVLETASAQEAAAVLVVRVKDDADLIHQLLIEGARQYIMNARMKVRGALENEYLDARERGLRKTAAALNGRATLFDWKLPITGKPIGDATIQDLGDAVDYHAGRAEFETGRSRMYRMVMERLVRSNKPVVREGISENELAKIMKNIDVELDA
jgi:hypothetical protein